MLSALSRRPATSLVSFALLASCGLPRDPEGTSKRLSSSHELRVGASEGASRDNSAGGPQGTEGDLVRRFAASKGARIQWVHGSETVLAQALEEHRLDLVIGGFEKKTPWSSTVGLSQPYTTDGTGKKRVLLVAPGENGFLLALDRFLAGDMRRSQSRS